MKDQMTDHELVAESKKHNVILCVSADNIGTDFINTCSHLEMISQFAVGYDNIDVPLATKLEYLLAMLPGAMNEATADIAFGLMIAVARKILLYAQRNFKRRMDLFQTKCKSWD